MGNEWRCLDLKTGAQDLNHACIYSAPLFAGIRSSVPVVTGSEISGAKREALTDPNGPGDCLTHNYNFFRARELTRSYFSDNFRSSMLCFVAIVVVQDQPSVRRRKIEGKKTINLGE